MSLYDDMMNSTERMRAKLRAMEPIQTQLAPIVGEVERRLNEHLELLSMVRRLTMNLRSVNLIGGSDARRTALCDEADALLLRCGRK